MKKLSLTTLSAIALLAAGSAFATDAQPTTPPPGAPHGGMHDKMMGETDTNKDGAISKEEWTAKGDKMFADIDADKDGKLTKDEMKAHHEKMKEVRGDRREKREERKEKRGEKPVEAPAAQ